MYMRLTENAVAGKDFTPGLQSTTVAQPRAVQHLEEKEDFTAGHAPKMMPAIIKLRQWHSIVMFNILRRKTILRQGTRLR